MEKYNLEPTSHDVPPPANPEKTMNSDDWELEKKHHAFNLCLDLSRKLSYPYPGEWIIDPATGVMQFHKEDISETEYQQKAISDFNEQIEEVGLSKEEVEEAIEDAIAHQLSDGHIRGGLVQDLIKYLNLSQETVVNGQKKGIFENLSKGNFGHAEMIFEYCRRNYKLSEEVMQSPEAKEALKKGLVYRFSDYRSFGQKIRLEVLNFLKDYPLLSREELSELATWGMYNLLVDPAAPRIRFERVKSIKEMCQITDSDFTALLKKVIEKASQDTVKKIKDEYGAFLSL